MKICTACGEIKDESEFYLTTKGRPAAKCKECVKSRVRLNRRKNIDHYREFDKMRATLPHRVKARAEYAHTENGRLRSGQAKKAYRQRNRVKQRAHNLVAHALTSGRLTKKPCEVCGNKKAHAHHDDYGKPLDVRWLCSKHHAEWHRNNTPLCPEQEDAA